MGPAIAFLVATSPFARDLKPNLERRYRVSVEQESGDRYDYRLRLKVVAPAKGEAPSLDVRMSDYRSTVDGRTLKLALLGGGRMAFGPTGLPDGLNVAGPQGPPWLPFLSLYAPMGSEDGEFLVAKTEIGPSIYVSGKGTLLVKDGRRRMEIDAAVSRGEAAIGKLTLSVVFDAAGWPTKAEGAFVGGDGTYRFALDRA